MSIAGVQEALVNVIGAVPGVKSVTRGEQFRPSRQGGAVPRREDCPAVRITQDQGRQRGFTLDGTDQRWTPYTCALWMYGEDSDLAADTWANLRDAITSAIVHGTPVFRAVPGVINVKVIGERPTRRPVANRGAQSGSLLHTDIVVQAWEEVR